MQCVMPPPRRCCDDQRTASSVDAGEGGAANVGAAAGRIAGGPGRWGVRAHCGTHGTTSELCRIHGCTSRVAFKLSLPMGPPELERSEVQICVSSVPSDGELFPVRRCTQIYAD